MSLENRVKVERQRANIEAVSADTTQQRVQRLQQKLLGPGAIRSLIASKARANSPGHRQPLARRDSTDSAAGGHGIVPDRNKVKQCLSDCLTDLDSIRKHVESMFSSKALSAEQQAQAG